MLNEKVLLILVDGMRPDGIAACEHPGLRELCKISAYTWGASTIMPSVTLPCHASLFLSVDPARHGITTNTWIPQVRPIDSLTDAAAKAGKKCAMFYNWEELRDLTRPGSLDASFFCRMAGRDSDSDWIVTRQARAYIQSADPDFVFLYLGATDEAGHHYGWMTPEYLKAVSTAAACIEEIRSTLPEGWTTIVTADHGGHDRTHGTSASEDMTIPLYLCGKAFAPSLLPGRPSIKDIAPTVAALMGFPAPADWEGHSLL